MACVEVLRLSVNAAFSFCNTGLHSLGAEYLSDETRICNTKNKEICDTEEGGFVSDSTSQPLANPQDYFDEPTTSDTSVSPVLKLREGPVLDFRLATGGIRSIDFSNVQHIGLSFKGIKTMTKVKDVIEGGFAEKQGVKRGWTLCCINKWLMEGLPYEKVFEELQEAMKAPITPVADNV